jgi:hypothetical protein
MSAGAEIQPADPAARRLALTIVVVIGALGLVPIIWLRNTSAVSSCRCSSCALHLCSPRGRVDRTGSTDELDCADELERTDESNSWESR